MADNAITDGTAEIAAAAGARVFPVPEHNIARVRNHLRNVLLRLSVGDADPETLVPDRWRAKHPEDVLTHRLDEARRKATRQKGVRG